MRRRTKRDLALLVSVIAILGAVALAKGFFERSDLANRMETARKGVEQTRKSEGLELLPWPIVQRTTGNVKKGPTFDDRLLPFDQQRVDIVGFMVPLEQFRDMTEFLLLPLPLECYFCQSPPMRDVMVVQMAKDKTTKLYREPVLINGVLSLNKGPGTKFFYVIKDAKIGPGKKGDTLTVKEVAPQHMIPGHEPTKTGQEAPLAKPIAPPTPAKLD